MDVLLHNCLVLATYISKCCGPDKWECQTPSLQLHYVKQYIPKCTLTNATVLGSDAGPVLPGHIHTSLMPAVFILRIRQLCSVNWEHKIWGSSLATIWPCAAVQQEGSHTLRPTTGCFLINKDFLLSTEVPTDAFIGAKFTLQARREFPLHRPEWRSSGCAAFSSLEPLVCFSKQVSQPSSGVSLHADLCMSLTLHLHVF